MVKTFDWGFHPPPRGVAILFACALAVVTLDALLFHYVTTSVARTTQGVEAARTQLDQFDEATDLLVDAETGVRGFLLVNRPEYLQPYDAATTRVGPLLDVIAETHYDDPSDRAQADKFVRLARAKLDELGRALDTYRASNRDSAIAMVATGGEKRVMDEIRTLDQAQRDRLGQRVDSARAEREQIIRWAGTANIAAAALALGVLVFFGAAIGRHLFRRRVAEQKIHSSHAELEGVVARRTHELEESLQTIQAQLEERMRQDAKLRDSEERLRILVEGVKDYAIYMIDPEGLVTSWNAGAERIKGYTADEIIGKNFSVFYTEEDRATGRPRTALQTALRDGKYEAEALRVRRDGSEFFANVLITPLRDASGHHVGFAKITRDVTERRQQQAALDETKAALAQSQKMDALGQLSGGIAHDFNNLLHVIRNAAEVLNRRLSDLEPDLRSMFDMITRNADRAANLTRRLLAFSRRQPLEPQQIDPNKLVQSMGALLRSAIGEAIELQIVCGVGCWRISADPNQLETAILNLAVNARDAMPSGGRLTIETTNAYLDEGYAAANAEVESGQYALIAVSDTGHGMSREVIARAFEPFFTTKEIGQGTGLGLSQVYGFIKQSGGHVKIYSEPGQGTTIKLYFPRLWAGAKPEAQEPMQPVSTARATETILVVEDEEDVLAFTATILRDLGYRVLTVNDAESALAVLEGEGGVDLLFTDVGLPRINGRQLADRARQRWPSLKVLFTTGYARNAIIHHGRLDPGVELIAKPFSQSGLGNKIRKMLDT
jgi:PAS domain S-box-containing protein